MVAIEGKNDDSQLFTYLLIGRQIDMQQTVFM